MQAQICNFSRTIRTSLVGAFHQRVARSTTRMRTTPHTKLRENQPFFLHSDIKPQDSQTLTIIYSEGCRPRFTAISLLSHRKDASMGKKRRLTYLCTKTARVSGVPCCQHGTECSRQRGMTASNQKAKRLCEKIASQPEVNRPWAIAK